VYIKVPVLESYLFDLPTSPVLLERKGCRVVPHVLGLRVGQPLMILNSDLLSKQLHIEYEAETALLSVDNSQGSALDQPAN